MRHPFVREKPVGLSSRATATKETAIESIDLSSQNCGMFRTD